MRDPDEFKHIREMRTKKNQEDTSYTLIFTELKNGAMTIEEESDSEKHIYLYPNQIQALKDFLNNTGETGTPMEVIP